MAILEFGGYVDGAFGGATFGISNTTFSGTSPSLVFVPGANISLAQTISGSSGTIGIAGAAAQTIQHIGLPIVGNVLGDTNIQGATISLAGGTNITLSGNAAASAISVVGMNPSTLGVSGSQVTGPFNVVMTGGTNMTLLQTSNGSSQTIQFNGPPPIYRTMINWEHFSNLNTLGQSSLSFKYMPLQQPLAVSAARVLVSIGVVQTSGNTSVGSLNVSAYAGIYSMSASTLSALVTGSANNAVSWASNTNQNLFVSGIKQMTLPLASAVTVPPGDYWFGFGMASATIFNTVPLITVFGGGMDLQTASMSGFGDFSGTNATTRGIIIGQGIGGQSASAPLSIALNAITQTGAAVQSAAFYGELYGSVIP